MSRPLVLMRGWWRLKRHSCPECGGAAARYHYSQQCRVCYGWAGKNENQGKRPGSKLVQNWRERFAAREK